MAVRLLILSFLLSAGLYAADVWTWWVDDCAGTARSGCNKDDSELARWAFEAWQRESGDRIVFSGIDHLQEGMMIKPEAMPAVSASK